MLKSLSLKRVDFPGNYFSVPTVVYDIIVEDIEYPVGRIEYRVETGKDLVYYGNIGYFINRAYRGNNYAFYACLKLLEIIDHNEIYITCNPDNVASKRTIEKLGQHLSRGWMLMNVTNYIDMEKFKRMYTFL